MFTDYSLQQRPIKLHPMLRIRFVLGTFHLNLRWGYGIFGETNSVSILDGFLYYSPKYMTLNPLCYQLYRNVIQAFE